MNKGALMRMCFWQLHTHCPSCAFSTMASLHTFTMVCQLSSEIALAYMLMIRARGVCASAVSRRDYNFAPLLLKVLFI